MTALPNLAGAAWLARAETQAVLAALTQAGHGARAVGGCVRNALLGEPVADIDIATTALPADVVAIAKTHGFASAPTGIDHGTVTVIVNHRPYEITTLRRDVTTDGRRATVAFTDDWTLDAGRRDFTMNALYCAADGTVHDPLGGYPDVVSRHVRFIGDAHQRIREDYLRILRFFRFRAQYGERIPDAAGVSACVRLRDGMRQLSGERIAAELLKTVGARHAAMGIGDLFDYGLLTDVLGAVPRLTRFARVVGLESALDQAPNAPLRLAALSVHCAEDAQKVGGRLRLSNEHKRVLSAAALPRPMLTAAIPDLAARSAHYRLGSAGFRQRLLLDWAASGAPPDAAAWRLMWALQEHEPPRFPVDGRDLLQRGISAGPDMGRTLRELEQRWIDSGFRLTREDLLGG